MSEISKNPIQKVDTNESIPCPSSYVWKLEDISSSDAGRTEDTTMEIRRIGQCVSLDLQWNYLDITSTAALLQAFNPEYITVTYLDAMAGCYLEKEFYVGGRSVPMYNAEEGRWENIAFTLTARSGQ